jgi:hypothetical protein
MEAINYAGGSKCIVKRKPSATTLNKNIIFHPHVEEKVGDKATFSKNPHEILRITRPKDESFFPYLFCNFAPSLP